MSELAERSIKCKHFRWMPGMLARYDDGEGWYRVTDGYGLPVRHVPPKPSDAWADLDDSATMGCLLALVREAYDKRVHVRSRANKWRCFSGVTAVGGWADTEAEALVAVLEAAP